MIYTVKLENGQHVTVTSWNGKIINGGIAFQSFDRKRVKTFISYLTAKNLKWSVKQ